VLGFKPTYFPALEQQQQGRPAPGSSIATTDSTTTVLLPLDYYACLRLPRASGSRAVREALDCALNHPPPVGYSADTLSVRAVLLRSAADCLLDLRTRKGVLLCVWGSFVCPWRGQAAAAAATTLLVPSSIPDRRAAHARPLCPHNTHHLRASSPSTVVSPPRLRCDGQQHGGLHC
jgi:hypothetical protein